MNNARIAIIRTDLGAIQLLEKRTRRSARVLAEGADVEDTQLMRVRVGQLLIAPGASEVEPVDRGAVVVSGERL